MCLLNNNILYNIIKKHVTEKCLKSVRLMFFELQQKKINKEFYFSMYSLS